MAKKARRKTGEELAARKRGEKTGLLNKRARVVADFFKVALLTTP